MSSYKVTVKSPGNGSPANPGRVSIIGPDGKAPKGWVQSIDFSAQVGSSPSLTISSLVEEFELNVCEENVKLIEFYPKGVSEIVDAVFEFQRQGLSQEEIQTRVKDFVILKQFIGQDKKFAAKVNDNSRLGDVLKN